MAFHSISFCSGLAGLELAVELACPGVFRPILYVEREISVAEILAARIEEGAIPAAPIWSDAKTACSPEVRDFVRERTADNGIGLLTAGYPCQPFSCAGRRRGRDDPRHIWPWIVDAIECYRPALCFFENVPGHLILGFREVRRNLEERGYCVQAGLFSAAEIGAPHKRLRLFILAVADGQVGRRRLRELRQSSRGDGQPDGSDEGMGDAASRAGDMENGHSAHGRRREQIAGDGHCELGHTLTERSERLIATGPASRPAYGTCRDDLPEFPPARNDYERWQRTLALYPWLAPAVGPSEAESRFCGVAHGFASAVDTALAQQWNARLRACGNGIVVETAAAAFMQLLVAASEALNL